MSTFLTIKKSLVDYIRIKNLKVGDKLPPESDLAGRLNVSRLTLREDLKVFREEGLIYSKGYFRPDCFKISINRRRIQR